MGPKSALDQPVDLRQFDDQYAGVDINRKETSAAADPVPDGMYEVRIENVRLGNTPNTGNPMVLWKLRILGPSHAGYAVTKIRVITPKTLPMLKEDLHRAGLDLDRLSDLENHLDDMAGRELTILKKHNPARGFTDVSFLRNRPAEADVDPVRKPPQPFEPLFPNLRTGTDDDLPF
jgi:hypothetical protein